MTANVIPTWQVQQYSSRIDLLLQQMESRFGDKVSFNGGYVGKAASPVDQVGSIEMQSVTSRFAPMGRVDAPTDRRWLYPSDFDLPQLVDKFDQLRLLNDPKSVWAKNAANAMNRKRDTLILSSFFADAKTGEAGGTTTTFTAGNVVGVNIGGTDSYINIAKIRAGLLVLRQNEVDPAEPVYCGLAAQDQDALLNEIQAINKDYNLGAVVVKGVVQEVLGVKFVASELVTSLLSGTDDQSGSSCALPMWVPSGMHLGVWSEGNTTAVTQREDLQGRPYQIYSTMTAGATRIDEKKVVKIWSKR